MRRQISCWMAGIVFLTMSAARLDAQDFKTDPGLVAYYSFDQDAADGSPHGNHGEVHGAIHAPEGKIGGAYAFNGKSDYIRVPRSPSLDMTNAVTVCAWVQRKSQTPGWLNLIVDKQWNDRGYHLAFYLNRMQVRIDEQWHEGRFGPMGEWSHAAGVYDGTNIHVYINGEKIPIVHTVANPPEPRGHGHLYAPPAQFSVEPKDLYIGAKGNEGQPPAWFFHGLLDEIYIFNRALSADEIRAVYELN